jgi:IrrE N-terminal-like domain
VTVLIATQDVLKELGVAEPSEIDIDAIAWFLGARVKYRPLDGCQACIAGNGDQAIITVNSRSSRRRKRFSVAHELGHWKYDRGRILVCRSDEIGRAGQNYPTSERVADSYAAQLLMPAYIFDPIARSYPKATFQTVTTIADLFDTSITATAIRLVEGRHFPAVRSAMVPKGGNGSPARQISRTAGFRRIPSMPTVLRSVCYLERSRTMPCHGKSRQMLGSTARKRSGMRCTSRRSGRVTMKS